MTGIRYALNAEEGMTKHTPGPWKLGEHPSAENDAWREDEMRLYERGIYATAYQLKIAVCEQWIGEKEQEEAEANATLISAAPELFEALETAEAALSIEGSYRSAPDRDRIYAALTSARAAIAKARGEA